MITHLDTYRSNVELFVDLLPKEAQDEFQMAVGRLVDAYQKEVHASALACSYNHYAARAITKAKDASRAASDGA